MAAPSGTGSGGGGLAGMRGPSRLPVSKAAAVAVLVVPAPVTVAAALITGSHLLGRLSVLVTLVYFMAWLVAGAQMIAGWHGRRSAVGGP